MGKKHPKPDDDLFSTAKYKRTAKMGEAFTRLSKPLLFLLFLFLLVTQLAVRLPETSLILNVLKSLSIHLGLATVVFSQALVVLICLRPYFYIRQSIDNLKSNRKRVKSLIVMGAAILGALLGAYLGSTVFNPSMILQRPLAELLLPLLVGIGCSMMAGDFVARVTSLMKSSTGMLLGASAFTLFSVYISKSIILGLFTLPVPAIAPIVVGVMSANVFSMLAKQAVRLHYYWRFGHTNADGYEFAYPWNKPMKSDASKAHVLQVQQKETFDLRFASGMLLERLKHMPHNPYAAEGKASVKNVLHAFMRAKDIDDKKDFSRLVKLTEEGFADKLTSLSSSFFGGIQITTKRKYGNTPTEKHIQGMSRNNLLFLSPEERLVMDEFRRALKPFK